MASFLIPMDYKGQFPNYEDAPKLIMNGQLPGYEAYKAFTSDDKEYLKVTGNIDMVNLYRSSGVRAILMVSDSFFTSTSNQLRLYSDIDSSFSSPMLNQVTAVYGDGINYTDYMGLDTTKSGLTKSLITYGTNSVWCFRIAITPFASQTIQSLTHGLLVGLPDNYRLTEQSFDYTYKHSVVKTNLVGGITYDGLQNNGIKRKYTLSFEYAGENDKATLLLYYQWGKGGLPIWFIDDLNDNSTWMNVGIVTMSVTETHPRYYNIELNMVEY